MSIQTQFFFYINLLLINYSQKIFWYIYYVWNKKTRNLLIALVVLCLAAFIIGKLVLPAVQSGSKTVTINVVHGDATEKNFKYKTDLEYLGELILEKKLAEGSTGEYGLYITTVDGETADDGAHQYWAIYVNGEMGMLGADSQPIADGDVFDLKLETW